MIFPPGMPPTITVWITTGAVSPVRPGSGGGRVAKAAGAAAPNGQDGAGQRGQDGGETGDEAGEMDAVPRDSRCGSGPIMQSYSPAASGVPGTPIGSDSMSR
jgi:hypothetical protein